MSRSVCKKHNKPRPCTSCRASRAGMVMTEKKRAANAAKSRKAALVRWKKFREAEK